MAKLSPPMSQRNAVVGLGLPAPYSSQSVALNYLQQIFLSSLSAPSRGTYSLPEGRRFPATTAYSQLLTRRCCASLVAHACLWFCCWLAGPLWVSYCWL